MTKWNQLAGSFHAPHTPPDELAEIAQNLADVRKDANPTEYFEGVMDLSARAKDLGGDTGTIHTDALDSVRNNTELLIPVYDKGRYAGRAEDTLTRPPFITATNLPTYTHMSPLLRQFFGRGRLDIFDDDRLREANQRTFRHDELKNILGAQISPELTAGCVALTFLSRTSGAIKDKADNNRGILEMTSGGSPDAFYQRLYLGGKFGKKTTIGAAQYFGFFETLRGETSAMFTEAFGEEAESVKRLAATALFLESSQRRSSTLTRDIRGYKADILQLVDSGEFDQARDYLEEVYTDNPGLFSDLALETVFGDGELPPTYSDRQPTSPKTAEDYECAELTSDVATQYCREFLGMTDDEINEAAAEMMNGVYGYVAPRSTTSDIVDVIHVTEYTTGTGGKNNHLKLRAYSIDPENPNELVEGKWRRQKFETLIASEKLGRLVPLKSDVLPEEISANSADVIAALHETV